MNFSEKVNFSKNENPCDVHAELDDESAADVAAADGELQHAWQVVLQLQVRRGTKRTKKIERTIYYESLK